MKIAEVICAIMLIIGISTNENTLSIIGGIAGLIYFILAVRSSIACYPFGILNVAGLSIILCNHHMYAYMIIEILFGVLMLYGWHCWGRREVPRRAKMEEISVLLVGGIIVTIWSERLLELDSSIKDPSLMAFALVTCIIAQYMMSRKIIESWVVWSCMGVISFIYCMIQGNLTSSIVYALVTLLSLKGLYNWNRIYIKEELLK
jgi:nicotinamide mononucleotide transporter